MHDIIELELLDPSIGLVRASGTDQRIKEPVECVLGIPDTADDDDTIIYSTMIGAGDCIQLYRDGRMFHESFADSVAVKVKTGWYDVF
jgi:hypothetical protein